MPDAPQDEPTGLQPTEMAPQPHGGAIRVGNPGNRGGLGRPRNPIKAIAAEGLRETIEEARARIKAAREAAKKGGKRMSAYELAQYGALFAKVATESAGDDEKPPSTIRVVSASPRTITADLEAERQAEDDGERLSVDQIAEDPATPSAGSTSPPERIPAEAPSGDKPGEQLAAPGPDDVPEAPRPDDDAAAGARGQAE